MKKNCTNCKHLEWVDGDCEMGSSHNSGFTCNKRYDAMCDQGREDELLNNLDRAKYREKAKRCCETVPEGAQVVDLTCPQCTNKFTGYKRDDGNICFDCFAYKEVEKLDANK